MLRNTLTLLLFIAVSAVPFAHAQEASKKKEEAKDEAEVVTENQVAVLNTTMGEIVIQFYAEDCPKTTANFIKLANKKFYDGTTFHRVITGFVVQGGDPLSKDSERYNDGQGDPGYTVPAEIKHKHKRGAVAAARLPDSFNPQKDSNGCQFYIVVKAQPSLDDNYTVFGEIIVGMDIVDKIVAVRKDARDNPIEPVVMTTVRIVDIEEIQKKAKKEKKDEKGDKS